MRSCIRFANCFQKLSSSMPRPASFGFALLASRMHTLLLHSFTGLPKTRTMDRTMDQHSSPARCRRLRTTRVLWLCADLPFSIKSISCRHLQVAPSVWDTLLSIKGNSTQLDHFVLFHIRLEGPCKRSSCSQSNNHQQ